MIVCPCGMVVEEETSWPPYRFYSTNDEGEIVYAVCIHGCVVIDRRKIQGELTKDFYQKPLTLDFSKCKTKEDVDKVFKEHKKEIKNIKGFVKKINQ